MIRRLIALVVVAALLLIGLVYALNHRDEATDDAAAASGATAQPSADLVARGEYLTRAGDCLGCHTPRGAAPYSGGRGIETPFGTVYAPNLTPDRQTGIGAWTASDFWRALHNGRSRDGRLLYPAFPYPNYTRVARADADAMFAYLRSLTPVARANRPHALRFPFDLQASLAIWRALYFRPGAYVPDPGRPAAWNRGAYLVEGLGHCNACHSSRNVLGAPAGPLDLAGGLIPVQNWYAPSLTAPDEASVADWDTRHVVDLLKIGVSARGTVMGPMTEVVLNGTQYLSEADLLAMTAFLKALPVTRPARTGDAPPPDPQSRSRGAKLYEDHCLACHGEKGDGVRRRLSAARRQPIGDDGVAGEPRPHRARGRVSAGHRRQSAAVRHAAVRDDAGQRRRRRSAVVHPHRVGQPGRRRLRGRGQPLPRGGAALRARAQNGMSSSMLSKPVDDFAAGLDAAAPPAGREAGAGRSA